MKGNMASTLLYNTKVKLASYRFSDKILQSIRSILSGNNPITMERITYVIVLFSSRRGACRDKEYTSFEQMEEL